MTRLTNCDALSFDCYGTLIDWESGISAVLVPWAAEHGVTLSSDRLLERFAVAESREEARTPAARYPEILAATLRDLAADVGTVASLEECRRLASSVPDWPAFPDSAAALGVLAARYKLIILSNIDRASFAGSNARLGVQFDAVITAEDVGSYKPAARNFTALVETAAGLGIEPGRLLHVAQSLFHDHVPAQRIGLPTVWINRRGSQSGWGATLPPESDVRPTWTFSSMEEFAAACVATAG